MLASWIHTTDSSSRDASSHFVMHSQSRIVGALFFPDDLVAVVLYIAEARPQRP